MEAEFWNSRLSPDLTPEEAREKLAALFKAGELEAQNPALHRGLLRVTVDGSRLEHCLFKPASRSRSRHGKNFVPADFLPDRAEMIDLVASCLLSPELILERPSDPQSLLYSIASPQGDRLIVVISMPRRGSASLKTFFPIKAGDPGAQKDWRKKLLTYKKRFEKNEIESTGWAALPPTRELVPSQIAAGRQLPLHVLSHSTCPQPKNGDGDAEDGVSLRPHPSLLYIGSHRKPKEA